MSNALARQQPGFLGIESVRDADDTDIIALYWTDLAKRSKWPRAAVW